jgi:hypothetical protein
MRAGGTRSVVFHLATAVRVPIALGVTLLGASVVLGRGLVGVLLRLLPSLGDEPPPRHHAGRVREQVRAAQQAARAAGVLKRRKWPGMGS